MTRLLQAVPFLIHDLYIQSKLYTMAKEKDGKKKTDKTAPLKTAKEKREDKATKRKDKESESRNATS